ncbi:MAG: hypothetical protein HC838_06135, partial [Spirulinaceae cyanobacterium RM2_2_10]|nr:hypothetical protein [Spirulinaceae cyanobacterium RM2_2_10]
FFDPRLPNTPWAYPLYNLLILPLVAILAAIALYWFWRRAPHPARLFVVLLFILPALAIILPDLLFGGLRSSVSRYFIPSYLALQLAVAYLFARQLGQPAGKQARRWAIGFVLLLSLGLGSGLASWAAPTWWNKLSGQATLAIADILNQAERPLLIGNTDGINTGHLVSLAHELDGHVRLQLTHAANPPQPADGFATVYLYNPSRRWSSLFPTAQPRYEGELSLWQLMPTAETSRP